MAFGQFPAKARESQATATVTTLRSLICSVPKQLPVCPTAGTGGVLQCSPHTQRNHELTRLIAVGLCSQPFAYGRMTQLWPFTEGQRLTGSIRQAARGLEPRQLTPRWVFVVDLCFAFRCWWPRLVQQPGCQEGTSFFVLSALLLWVTTPATGPPALIFPGSLGEGTAGSGSGPSRRPCLAAFLWRAPHRLLVC